MDEFHYYADPDRGWAWQVPLLTLPRAQFVLMSATLGDTRRFEDELTAPHRAPHHQRHDRHPAGAARLRVPPHRPARDHRHPAGDRPGAGLRRPLHPAVGGRAGPGPDERQRVHPGGEGRDRRVDRGVPVRSRVRAVAVALRPPRHRRPPRRDAAQVPAAGRAAGPGGPAQGHLRHRHAGGRHQRPDPDRAVHPAVQVRRDLLPAALGPRVPPGRGPGRAGRVRHGRLRVGPGARARHRERAGTGQGRRRRPQAPQGRARPSRRPGATCPGTTTRSPAWPPPRPSR